MAKNASDQAEQPTKSPAAEPTFTGEQLIRAAKGISRDVMAATLSPSKQYTASEAENIVDNFLKKEVAHNGGR